MNNEASNSDRLLAVQKISSQLAGLLYFITGEGAESFGEINAAEQRPILWLASDLAEQIESLSGEIRPASGSGAA
jgi:hypothetical protein